MYAHDSYVYANGKGCNNGNFHHPASIRPVWSQLNFQSLKPVGHSAMSQSSRATDLSYSLHSKGQRVQALLQEAPYRARTPSTVHPVISFSIASIDSWSLRTAAASNSAISLCIRVSKRRLVSLIIFSRWASVYWRWNGAVYSSVGAPRWTKRQNSSSEISSIPEFW